MEEQLLVAQLHRVQVRVCAAQCAGSLLDQITFNRVGASMGDDPRRLIRQMFSRVDDFVLNCDLAADVLSILYFFKLPGALCHFGLLALTLEV